MMWAVEKRLICDLLDRKHDSFHIIIFVQVRVLYTSGATTTCRNETPSIQWMMMVGPDFGATINTSAIWMRVCNEDASVTIFLHLVFDLLKLPCSVFEGPGTAIGNRSSDIVISITIFLHSIYFGCCLCQLTASRIGNSNNILEDSTQCRTVCT